MGEYLDQDSGFYHLRARDYDPKIGRFMSRDRFEGARSNPLTLNPYLYANTDPVTIDSSGDITFGQIFGAVNLVGQMASLSYGGYLLLNERYDEAAWIFATESFWGIASYKKAVQWLRWWTTNRTIRASYNESIKLMLIKQKIC